MITIFAADDIERVGTFDAETDIEDVIGSYIISKGEEGAKKTFIVVRTDDKNYEKGLDYSFHRAVIHRKVELENIAV